jgi:surface polysaccharide O-acyltransferase-like enzyme
MAEFCFGIALAQKNSKVIFIPLLFIFVNPVMIIPFLLFFLFSQINIYSKSPKLISFMAISILPIFLFHEGLFNLIFDKWIIYSLPKPLSIVVYLFSVSATIFISNKIVKIFKLSSRKVPF